MQTVWNRGRLFWSQGPQRTVALEKRNKKKEKEEEEEEKKKKK